MSPSTTERTNTPTMAAESLKQLLLRGWMTHDAMWFKNVVEKVGIKAANELNRAAVQDMAPIEVRRLLGALGMEGVSSFGELEVFMRGAMDLLAGDYLGYTWRWEQPDRLHARISRCFAHQGVTRLGVAERYECGIYDRIYGWLDALGVGYRVVPQVEYCTMHHEGTCVRELRFSF